MKLTVLVFLLLSPLIAGAQQAPDAARSTRHPEGIPAGAVPTMTVKSAPLAAPPMPAPPRASQPGNDELMNLVRAQTSAIRSLSSKIDLLEERLGRLEGGR